MKTLVVDTSTAYLCVAFLEDSLILYKVCSLGANNHSERLLPEIEDGLNKTHLKIRDFDRIILGIGPGSYTGLKVSMACCKMFSWSLDIPLYTISSLDLLTTGYSDDGKYCICFRAKQGYSYVKKIILEKGIKTKTEEKFLKNTDIDIRDEIVITEKDLRFDPEKIRDDDLSLVKNIHLLVPNYLRGV